MKWFKIDLTLDEATLGPFNKIFEHIRKDFKISIFDENAAVFSSPLRKDGLSVFFTEKAADICKELIIAYNASECEAPPKQFNLKDWTSRLRFLAGNRAVYKLLEGKTTEPPR